MYSRLATIIAATLAASAALAQQSPPAGGTPGVQATGTPGATLDEVVVTAQRREESLQTVPVSVSAFTADQLEQRQITSTIDVVRVIPNLVGHNNTGTATSNTYFLRGLGSTEQIATIDPAVSTYVDDVIIPRQNANNYALFDVERIEVLRGPQGTTFGRNSTGGAISVITRRPSPEFGGYVTAGGGNYGRLLGRASIDLPVSDRVLTKVSGYYTEEDGWLKNVLNGEELNGVKSWGVRVAGRFLLTDAVSWDLAVEQMNTDGVYLRSIVNDPQNTRTTMTTGGGTGDLIGDMLNRRDLHNETRATGVTSNIEWRVSDAATLNAITGYRTVGQTFILDFSLPTATGFGFPALFAINNDGEYDMFSQEFKLAGSLRDNLRYVAGVYYFQEDNVTKAGQAVGVTTSGAIPAMSCVNRVGTDTGGNMTCNGVPGYSSWRDIRNETTSYAIYAQADWEFVPGWTAILGARYTDDKKELDILPTSFGGITTADLVRVGIPVELDTSLVTPKVGLEWQVNEDFMTYATATRGFKSGGWNARTAYRPQEFTSMQPEKTWSYELGAKSELFDNRLRLNAGLFFAETEGLQLAYTIPGPPPQTTLSVQDNAGDVEVKGVELEFVWRAFENLDVYGSAGWQDGEYTETNPRAASFCTNGGTVVNGACASPRPPATTTTYTNAIDITDELSRLADNTFALGFNWRIPVGFGGAFRISAEANYNSGYWTTASNATPTLRLVEGGPLVTPTALETYAPSYTLWNVTAGYESESGAWRALVECKNCGDEEYLTAVFNGAFYGEPRRINGSVTFRF